MQAYTSWHNVPSAESYSYESHRSSAGSLEKDSGFEAIGPQNRIFVPSVTSLPSPPESLSSMSQSGSDLLKQGTQHESIEAYHLDGHIYENHRNGTTHDSGLGIITHEDVYNGAFHNSASLHGPSAALTTPKTQSSSHAYRKLSSPFDEQMYTTAPTWTHGYPQFTVNGTRRPAFNIEPAQQFFSSQVLYPSAQYSIPPANSTPNTQHYMPIQHDVFKHPSIHQNSIHSPHPQQLANPYSAPVQMSPWTPNSSISVWQSTPYATPLPAQVPSFAIEQQMHHDERCSPSTCNSAYSTRTALTVPLRRKPHLRPSLSESCVPRISPARMRAASVSHFLQPPSHNTGYTTLQQQLPLPPLPPSVLVNTPILSSSNFTPSGSPRPTHRPSRSTSSTPNRRKRPSSPPASDFASTNVPYLIPVRQDPTFQGDLYTPKYKRRTSNGRWEGWCGYCQPGRWLDLKNSRYWEDKLRNHGICAKTKMKFAEPVEIRWVNADGSLIANSDRVSDFKDPFSDQRKREGLCGTCKVWIAMDGLRTKARDRAVGWWMHAYKCHDHDKSHDTRTSPAYAAHTSVHDVNTEQT